MFQNTIRFNHILSKENSKMPHQKQGLMQINETGLLIQFQMVSGEMIDFWIVGRLFGKRELFVCYEASIPQNMVEIAFRIQINCIG